MNKKILIGLASGAILLSVAFSVFAQARLPDRCSMRAGIPASYNLPNCPTVGNDCIYADVPQCGMCCVLSTVIYITNWFFTAMLLIVMVFVLLGAFSILTAAGDPEKVKTGKNYILYAAIGLGLGLMARAVPALVAYLFNPPG